MKKNKVYRGQDTSKLQKQISKILMLILQRQLDRNDLLSGSYKFTLKNKIYILSTSSNVFTCWNPSSNKLYVK